MASHPGGDALGHPAGSPSCTSLLSLLDWRGAALCVSADGSLRFQESRHDGQCSAGSAGGVWLLASSGGAPSRGGGGGGLLQHAASGRFLAVAGGRLVLSDAPQPVHLFMDMERSECCTPRRQAVASLPPVLPVPWFEPTPSSDGRFQMQRCPATAERCLHC